MKQVLHNETLERATIPCGGGALAGTPGHESIGEQLTSAAFAAGWRYCIEAPAIEHQKAEGWTDDGHSLTQHRTPYSAEELAAQAAQAEANRLAWEAERAAQDAALKALESELDNANRITKALALTILDELNRIATRIRDFDSAVAAASSLADLKTRAAALSAIADRTVAQLKTAVRNRAQELP